MFSDDDVAQCDALMSQPIQPTGTDDLRRATIRRIMEKTAALLAARGGALTADALSGPNLTDEVRRHVAAQGARIATLQADNERAVVLRALSEERSGVRALERHVSDLEKSLENTRASENVWRKRVEAAAEALADVLPGEVGRLDLLSRIAALKAENAQLQSEKDSLTLAYAQVVQERETANHPGIPESSPAGQVAEDEALLVGALEHLNSKAGLLGFEADKVDAAVRRLATADQERDAALADNAAVVERLRAALTEEGARAFVAGRESRDDEVKRLEKVLDRIAREDVDNPYNYARMALEDGH